MGRPYKPLRELQSHLQYGRLDMAIIVAHDFRDEWPKGLPLQTALRFLPLIATQQPHNYDPWAIRWLTRWITETPAPTINQAAHTAHALAELIADPDTALDRLTGSRRRTPR